MKRTDLRVAVTGGIGSGKSELMRIFARLGYPVFSSDSVVADLYRDKAFCEAVSREFGLPFDGSAAAKKALSEVVFRDRAALSRLDAMTHPEVYARLDAAMRVAGGLTFAEVPLLFESGGEGRFDRTVVVLRDRAERIRAAAERDGAAAEEIELRMKNQFDYENFDESAHTVIVNDGSIADLEAKAVALVEELKRGENRGVRVCRGTARGARGGACPPRGD